MELADSDEHDPVGWSLLSAFRNFGGERMAQVQTMRPIILSETPAVEVQCTAKYNYDMSEPTAPTEAASAVLEPTGPEVDATTVAQWNFDEATAANNAADEVGTYDLTAYGSPDVTTGQIGGARTLSATKFFQRAGTPALSTIFNGSYSFSMWTKPTALATKFLLMYNGLNFSSVAADIILAEFGTLAAGGVYQKQYTNVATSTTTSGAFSLTAGAMNHVGFTSEYVSPVFRNIRLYVNGAADTVALNVPSLGVLAANHYLGLGCYVTNLGLGNAGAGVFLGDVDVGRLNSGVRTAASFLEEYENGIGVGQGVGGVDGAWDGAIWDAAQWASEFGVSRTASGASGMGTSVALALRGNANSRTTLVGVDVRYKLGGLR